MFMPSPPVWESPDWIQRSQWILDSYRRWTGSELIDREGTPRNQSQRLYEAPFVVVAHGTQADPILNYGNAAALRLWEFDLETLLRTPSRMTAEPMHRDERARLLERTTRQGFVDDYSGIRISATGRRFLIERATVWNLLDEQERPVGQAATFQDWKELPH